MRTVLGWLMFVMLFGGLFVFLGLTKGWLVVLVTYGVVTFLWLWVKIAVDLIWG